MLIKIKIKIENLSTVPRSAALQQVVVREANLIFALLQQHRIPHQLWDIWVTQQAQY